MINSFSNFAPNVSSKNQIVAKQKNTIDEIANDCLKEAFEDLCCIIDYMNTLPWEESQKRGLETIRKVLSTEDKGKKAFKELLISTIDATPNKQKAICSKLLKLPLEKEIDVIKVVEDIFWGLQCLEEEGIIPKINTHLYEIWNKRSNDFYVACFQHDRRRNVKASSTSNEGNKDNLAAMLYILKEIPNDENIVDQYLHPVYKPIIQNILIRQKECKKEMRYFLLAENRINKKTPFKLNKYLKLEIFNYLLNTMK